MKWLAGLVVVTALLFAAVTALKRRDADAPAVASSTVTSEERARQERFWDTYRRATDLRITGATAEAALAYTEALALNPEHQDALYYLGSMAFDLGDFPGAERAWRRLVDVDPSNARAHSQLGVLYSCVAQPQVVDLDRAAQEFERAMGINREQTGPLLHLGEVALFRGDLTQAHRYFAAVVGSNSTSVVAHAYLAYIAWKTGAAGEAAALLETAAGHARDAGSVAPVPGEGDTRTGSAPLVTASRGCRPMRITAADLALPGDQVAARADSLYRAIDSLLQGARRGLGR